MRSAKPLRAARMDRSEEYGCEPRKAWRFVFRDAGKPGVVSRRSVTERSARRSYMSSFKTTFKAWPLYFTS